MATLSIAEKIDDYGLNFFLIFTMIQCQNRNKIKTTGNSLAISLQALSICVLYCKVDLQFVGLGASVVGMV